MTPVLPGLPRTDLSSFLAMPGSDASAAGSAADWFMKPGHAW